MNCSNHPASLEYTPENSMVLHTSRGTEVIDWCTIIRVEAIGNYSKVFFANGKTLVLAKVLAWFEEQMADKGFLRLHRSHLVNLRFVLRWDTENNASVILKNYYSLPVSRRKKRYCRQTILQSYNGQPAFAA